MLGRGVLASRARRMFVSAAALLAVSLAGAESDAQTRTGIDHTEAHAEAAGQPIRLAYLCGNRFLVTSTLRNPVTLRFRVAGTDQEGTVGLQGLPEDDPEVSEAVLETRSPGRVELMLGGRRVAASDNGRVPCVRSTPVPTEPDVSAAAPADDGAWTAPFNWPVVAVHLSLLPNGRVLSWGLQGTPRVWNPATNAFTAVPSPDLLFCAGHAFLADGRLLVAGGHIGDRLGLPDINLFATAGGWQSAAPMAQGRWYPSATTMANGQVVILAGSDEDGTNVLVPEVWNPGRHHGAARRQPLLPLLPPRVPRPERTAVLRRRPRRPPATSTSPARAAGPPSPTAGSPTATTARPRCTRRARSSTPAAGAPPTRRR